MRPLTGKVALVVGVANAPSIAAGCAAAFAGAGAEPGPKIIRVNAISPGPLQTRAGSGIFRLGALIDALIGAARARAPEPSRVSGDIACVDGGLHVRA